MGKVWNRFCFLSLMNTWGIQAMFPASFPLGWAFSWPQPPKAPPSFLNLNKCYQIGSWRKKWQPTPVFLPGEFPWREEPGGLLSMGSHRVRHDWTDLAAAAADSKQLSSWQMGLEPWHNSLPDIPGSLHGTPGIPTPTWLSSKAPCSAPTTQQKLGLPGSHSYALGFLLYYWPLMKLH